MAQYIPSPLDWVREQVELYESSGGTKGTTLRDTGLPVIIVTGGMGAGDTTSEAQVSRLYLLEHGVPDSGVVMETHGLTTSQSIHAVAAIVSALPGRRVILVSDPFHMLRLSILARALGLTPLTSPTRTSPISSRASARWKYVFTESLKAPAAYLIERASD